MIDYSFSYGDLEYFLLILIRVSAFVYVAPFFSIKGIPRLMKVGFSVLLSMMLYDVVPRESIVYSDVLGYAFLVAKEVFAGVTLGFSAQICILICTFSGHIVDMMTGLSMVSIMDPSSNQQVTITGALYQQVMMVILVITGMYRFLIRAIADSFIVIPVNGTVINSGKLLTVITEVLRDYVIIGFRITLPVFIIMFTMNIVLGVLAKVSPQLNMIAVGIQIKILVGLSIMFLTCGMLGSAADFIFSTMKTLMQEFAYGLQP